MRRPGILLLDRTIAEADPDVQELMRKEFANINRELGITVIYATDNQKTAMALGTRTIVMNDGEICQEDSAQNIYDHPESLFVAGFFGTPRMDLSIARVLEENGNIVLEFASGKIRLSGEKAEQLKKLDYVGKEVFTGVRPEKIVPAKDGRVRSPERFLAAKRSRMPHTSVSVLEKTNFLQKHPTAKSHPERKCPLRFPATMCTFSTKKQKKLLKNNHNCSVGLRTCCADCKETYEGTE